MAVAMSGNFVQRGEPAIIDKWLRTKMALNNGVDLVIELPSLYALSSAEFSLMALYPYYIICLSSILYVLVANVVISFH